jgi:hypothetical protein
MFLKYGNEDKINNLLSLVFEGFKILSIDVLEEDVFHAVLLIDLTDGNVFHTVRYFVNYFALEQSYVLDVA